MATQSIRRFNGLVKAAGFMTGAPKSVTTSTKTFSRTANAGRVTAINRAAGSALTLPAAKGLGDIYKIVVATLMTSGTLVVSAAGSDNFAGGILINDIGDTAAATADFWPTASNSNTITLTQSVGGGKVGDYIEVQDIASGVWFVRGIVQGVTDPTTPFSHV